MTEERRWQERCTRAMDLLIAIVLVLATAIACVWAIPYLQTGIVAWWIALAIADVLVAIGVLYKVRTVPPITGKERMARWAIEFCALTIAFGAITLCFGTLVYFQTGGMVTGAPWLILGGLLMIVVSLPFLGKAARWLAQSSKNSR